MRSARDARSGWPCGRWPRCATFAAVNNDAEALGQAATHAPQPMQAAASIAASASRLAMRVALASGALPVGARDVAARGDDAIQRAAVDDQVAHDGKARARQGSSHSSSPSRKLRRCSWHTVVRAPRAVRDAVDHEAARAADALAAIALERDRLAALAREALVQHVEHLEERHVRRSVVDLVAHEPARLGRGALPPHVQTSASLVAPLRSAAPRSNASGSTWRRAGGVAPGVLPDGDVREPRVVALRLAVGRLVLVAEVAAARFVARERVAAHQLAELEEVGDAPGPLERLVELARRRPGTIDVAPELLAQLGDLRQRVAQPARRARHPAAVPQQLAQLAMERVRGLPAARREQRVDAPARRPRPPRRRPGDRAPTGASFADAR